MKKLLLTLFFLAIFGPLVYLLFLVSPTSLSGKEERFLIAMDTKQEEIVQRLKKENYIKSPAVFNLVASLIKFPGNIEPGTYMLSRSKTTWSIANTLLNNPYQKWIVLVPGLRKEQVAEKLKEKFKWDATKTNQFLAEGKEGYLFPDTYLLNVDYTGKEFAQRLMSNFNEKFDTQLQTDLLIQDVRNDTAVKIASLIERESGGSDKELIAGIIWNRLSEEMKLQIDAATQYILGKPGNWWPHVTPADHKIESPYNTYIHKGLPPGPIANPSLASIKAAVYPEETDCLYYIHDKSKQIHCSDTYKGHLENIEKYLK